MLEKLLGKEFKRVMAFMKPRMGQYVASLLIANIAADGFTIIEALALKLIMDAALSGQRASLVVGIVVVGVSVLAPIILIPVFGWIYQRCAHQTSAEIRLAVFSHICELPISYFDKNHSGDIVSRITSDASLLSNIYTFKLRRFVAPVIYGVCSAVVMLLLDGRIACALIVFNLISAYVNVRFGKPMRQVSDKVQQTIGNMTGMLIDFLAGFSIIRMFHIEQSVFGTYQETSYQVADYSISRYRLEGALDSTDFLLSAVSNLGTVIVGSYLVANGITEFGDLLALISLQAGLNRSLLQASYYLPQVQESMAGASRVLELLDAPTEPERYDLPQFETSCAEVEMKQVSFSYEQGNLALDKVNISVEKGQVIALVGPSGGGKSTIFRMLLGFYPPQTGNISIKGQALSDYSLKHLRDTISYVPQNAYLFSGTIEENIKFGQMSVSFEQVVTAAKAASAHNFIAKQSQGYETLVGERGTRLSGGQRQRIAIARALLKNAPILLLDEATSSLDSHSEQLVQEALNELMKDRTTIVIAHRLSTVQRADVIYVINDGKVIEQGSHSELIETGELYKSLHEAFTENYYDRG